MTTLIENEIKIYGKMYIDLRQKMRVLAIETDGIHLVSQWEDGGSDAINLPEITTAEKLLTEFPETSPEDAKAFFEGIHEGFIVDNWIDEHGRKVKSSCYFPCYDIITDKEIYYEDSKFCVNLKSETIDAIKKETEIKGLFASLESMRESEKDIVLRALAQALSSLDTGESDAWDFLAKLEAHLINMKNPPLRDQYGNIIVYETN